MDLKADRLELKALRGGIALNILRTVEVTPAKEGGEPTTSQKLKVVQLPPTKDGITPTVHFHDENCLMTFFTNLISKATEETAAKKVAASPA